MPKTPPRITLVYKAAAHWAPTRPVCMKRCTKPGSARLGDWHLHRRHQRQPDCRQHARASVGASAAFWKRVEHGFVPSIFGGLPFAGPQLANWLTMANGVEGFFTPNHVAFTSPTWPLGMENAGYYSTRPLRRTLSDLVDFGLINNGACRLTVGAANVRTAMMRYFDSRDHTFDVRHVMASGALPPAFPPC